MPKKILIIEDDRFLRELMSRKLLNLGYDVALAVDGEDGLNKIAEVRPDIALLDLIMPGMNGFEVLEKAKSNPEISDIPIIVLSNLGQREDIDRALELGALDFMVKAHFTPQEIMEKVEKIFSEKEQQDA